MQETKSEQKSMLQEVLEGMGRSEKKLPSKYFYDERGSQLFDEITKLEEYYPTRTEWTILEDNVYEMREILSDNVLLIEPGSGSSKKTRVLLDHIPSICCYIPMDISGDYLQKVAEGLREEYPQIDIQPLYTDYTRPFLLPEIHLNAQKVVFFPGSTIGNFEPKTVRRFFKVISDLVGDDGGLFIGVDLKKDRKVLEAAYDDKKGITAQFNKNMLIHINNELDSDFDPDKFEHRSIWNEEKGRIEMHLIANQTHSITIDGKVFSIQEGEFIHTENSHKYSLDEFEKIVEPWFKVSKVWTDKNKYFSVQFLEPTRD